ncbi:MAG: family 4 glycosyl hydrolase [Anaerolineae bacterium]
MGTKISLIGAGSAVFSLSLIRDLCLTPNLAGSTVSFMDIDPGRLDASFNLCKRYADEVGIHLDLQKTTDRRASMDGADFVVNTALVAGHHAMEEGFEIGLRHGYRFGGSYHIMHDEAFWINYYQYALWDSIMQDVMEVCPDSWHLLVANPVLAGTTYLMNKYPKVKLVGLCHGYSGVYHLAKALGLTDRDALTFEIPGVNHFVWLTKCFHQGQDVFPILDRYLEERAGSENPYGDLEPVRVDLYRRFGVFPIGDTGSPGGGTWPWWYHTDAETEQRFREDPETWWRRYFEHTSQRVAEIRAVADDPSLRVTERFPAKHSGEVMVPMIEAMACDIPRVLIGNILNTGDFVPGVPRDFEVEIPLLVSKRGIEGIRTGGLPSSVLPYVLIDRVGPVNLELLAYQQGSKELLLQLVMLDPWTRSEEQARAFLDEILALPYHEQMRAHYR